MSPEERDELMEFILQSQSEAAARYREMSEEHRKIMEQYGVLNRGMMEQNREMMEQNREMKKRHDETMEELEEHTTEIQALASVSRDFLEIARIHSRRLDRLEGLTN